MTVYQPGQRICLIHTSDPHTDLRPGDTGTVRHHDQHRHTVHIDWDTGSRLSMCLDAGDRIEATEPAIPGIPQPSGDNDGWAGTLETLRTEGAEAGRNVAKRWALDTIGGRAAGDVRATARRILAGIHDGDPAVLDGLPTFTPPIRWHDGRDTAQVRYTEAAHGQAPHWLDLTDAQRAETIKASRDAFNAAVAERVAELYHLAASPTSAASQPTPPAPPDPTAFTFAITIVTETPVPTTHLDEVLTRLGDAATNLIARTIGEGAVRTVATDWTRHTCALAATGAGGDLEYEAHYGAPGVGPAWRCVRCQRSWARVGNVFHDPADGAHVLRPEDVV